MSLTDRELLEMAAKASEIKICHTWTSDEGRAWSSIWTETERGTPTTKLWNPLGSDGAALRLAVKLGICIVFMEDSDSVGAEHSAHGVIAIEAMDEFGTRRAIVRAAAEIGRAMP